MVCLCSLILKGGGMDEKTQERPPPRQLVELKIQSGGSNAKLSWEPRTGVITAVWTGGPGNAVAVSRRFDKMKATRMSDFIKVAHEFLTAAFGEPGAQEDVRKVVGSMMSVLPEERESDRGEEKRGSNEGTSGSPG